MEGSPRNPRLIMSIQVMDNGLGVDDAEKLFEPFFSTKKEAMGLDWQFPVRLLKLTRVNHGQKQS
jgi:nitrogen-specific signal transduction histidine kinase